jgi:formylglycine-generating enzyme required for sulfatase activity
MKNFFRRIGTQILPLLSAVCAIAFVAVIGFGFVACDDGSGSTNNTINTYAVIVNGGSGSGNYAAGTNVTITATVPSGQQFTNWTVNSGGATLVNANSASTTFTMPANAVSVTANFTGSGNNNLVSDIDSALAGTSWKDNVTGNVITIAFTNDGITWGGTAGNTLNSTTAMYQGTGYTFVWIAKNGTISYKYSYNGGTAQTMPVYTYTLNGNTLELKASGITFATLVPVGGGGNNNNLVPDIDSVLAGTSWKDNVTGNIITIAFTNDGITWGGTAGNTLNSTTAMYQGTGYTFVWIAKNGTISYKYSYNGGTVQTMPVYTYTLNGNTLELKTSGYTFATLVPVGGGGGTTVTPGTMSEYSAGGVSFNMAAVPGGITFPTGEYDGGSATVADAYQIGETEVTWELWNTVRTWAAANGYSISEGQKGNSGSGSDQQPATMMSWYDTVVWCNALTEYWNVKTGANLATVYNSGGSPIRNSGNTSALDGVTPSASARGFRLPTNNEWELAARWRTDAVNTVAGYSNPWFTKGDSASGATANVYDNTATGNVAVYDYVNSTAIVKTKAPNALGLYDMSGNVWEWCFEVYTIRGGPYDGNYSYQKIGVVYGQTDNPPSTKENQHGFRIARTGYVSGEVTPPVNTTINISVIQGVTAPVAGATPVTAITVADQYTGTVSWNGNPSTFAFATQYTATITLTAKSGYTLQGVTGNFFTVAGATSVSNNANSGVVTAVFPATGDRKIINVSTPEEFAMDLAVIQSGTDSAVTIPITADLSLAPQALTNVTYKNKTITLKGNTVARTISLSSNGSLFTVGEGVELVLENIILKGRGTNNAPLVKVNAGGKLVVNGDGKVTGNTFVTSTRETGGAGVLVDGGTLEIAGGEVSGNTVSGTANDVRGGGICAVNGSSVMMTGGAIRNNRVTNVHSGDGGANGGGIALYQNCSFEMTGGVIEGNALNDRATSLLAGTSGGGVFVRDNSVFYFKGGTIRNNTCQAQSANTYGGSYGGGVYITTGGKLVMSGGVINGNSVSHSINPNKSYGGGGMYIDGAYGGGVSSGDGSIEKTGGIIYGNGAVGNDVDGIPLKNTAQSDSNGLGGGHAVFHDNGLGVEQKLRRNATASANNNMDTKVSGSAGGWE